MLGRLRTALLAALICLSFACRQKPPLVAVPAPDNAWQDLVAPGRLSVTVPILRSGGFLIQAATDTEGTTLSGADLIGFQISRYTILGKAAGRVRLKFESVEITKDGKKSAETNATQLPFALPDGYRHIRLIYFVRGSHADHNMAIVAATTRADLSEFTSRMPADPSACEVSNTVSCVWVPLGIAVRTEQKVCKTLEYSSNPFPKSKYVTLSVPLMAVLFGIPNADLETTFYPVPGLTTGTIGERNMHIPRPFVFLAFAATCVLEAANPPKSFVMKTTEPVIVSNTLLAPGNHLWRLLDSQSNRHIVQISDQTTQRVEAVIMAIPRYREVISSENEVEFWETPVGYAKAVRTWFLPGDNSGQEFPYSKKVVLSLGRLLTPPPAAQNQVEPAAPSRPRSLSIKPHEAEDKVSTQWPEGSWAVITDGPPVPVASPKPATHRNSIWNTLKHLPLTATIAPLIGLIGATLVLLFVLSGRRKNRQMPASR